MIKNLDNIIATAKKTAVAKKIAEPILNSNLTKPTLQETQSKQIPEMRFKKAVVTPVSPIKTAQPKKQYELEQSAISKVAPVSVDPFSATDIKPFAVEQVKKQEAGDVGKFVKDVAKTNWAQVGDEVALSAKTTINNLKSVIFNPIQDVSMTEKNRNLVTAIAGKDVSNALARTGVEKNIKSEANKQAIYEENVQNQQEVAQKYVGQEQSEFGKIVSGVGSGIVQMAPMMVSNLIAPNSGLMVMFATVGENEYRTALAEGATPEQANLYGLLKAGVEVGTEMAFGGIPLMGEGLADKTGLKKWVTSGIGGIVEDSLKTVAQSEVGKAFMSKAIDVLGEGAEEYVSEVLGSAIVGVYKKPDKTLWESATSKEAWDAWLIGSLTSAMMNLGQYGAGKTLQTVALETKLSKVSEEENLEIAKALAEKMGADLVMVDSQDNRNGSFVPAKDGARAQIYISENTKRPIATVALHETAHALINQTQNGEAVVKDFLSIYYDGQELTDKFAKTKAKYQNFYDQNLIMESQGMTKQEVDALSDADYVRVLNETIAKNPKARRIATTDEMLEEVFAETLEGVIDSAEGMRRLVTSKPKIADKIRSQIAKLGAQLSGDDNFLLVRQMEDIFNEYMQGYESYKKISKAQNAEQMKEQLKPQTELGKLLATVKTPARKPVMASLEAKTEKPVVDTTKAKQAPKSPEMAVKQPESLVDMMEMLIEEDALLENPDEDMGTDEPILDDDLIQPAEELIQEVKQEIKEKKKKDTTPKEVKAMRTPTVAKKISRVTPKTNVRKHEQTIASTDVISDNQKSRIDRDIEAGKFTYDVYSDSKSLGYADSVLSLGMDQAYNNFIAKVAGGEARITKGDIAIAERLIQEYSHMQGQHRKVSELIQYLSIAGTELGQAVQAMSLIKKIGTYGQMMAIQKLVDRMERQYLVANNKKGNIAQQKLIKKAIEKAEAEGADPEVIKKLNEKLKLKTLGIVIDENLKQALLETNPEDTKAVQQAVDAIKLNIASQIPATVTDRLNAWRYLSMLGNPKTHVRNLIGNATFKYVGRTKDLVATVLEKKLPVEERTKAILNKKTDKAVLDYARESYAEMADLMDVGSKYDMQNEIERMKTIFKTKWLEKARLKNFEFLEKEDAIFKKSAYIHAMAMWIKVKGLNPQTMSKEQIQQAKNHAVNEALKMTFQDASEFASALNQFEKRTGTAGKILMGGIIPFKKTPINILKRGVEYSPLGLATLVPAQFMEYRKGNITQAELIDSVSAGLTGTGIALVGAMLASMGFLNIDDDEDKKKNAYDEMLGKQNYSINVGGTSFTIDWAVPSAMPLFIGAHIWKQMNENGANLFDPNVLPTAMAGIFNPAFEMSMLQGLTNALKSYNQTEAGFIGDVITNVGESYAGQFVPTVSGQLARIIDQTRRSTYAPKDSPINPVLETFLRRMANKVPLASFMNPAMVNAQGVDLKQSDNVILRAINNLLNPAYVESSKVTDQDREIIKLFEDTKNSDLLPKTAPKSFTFNKKTYTLNSEEYSKFAKTMGTTSYELVKKLTDNPTYQILTVDEKTELVKSLYEYARSKAQAEYLASKNVAITNKEYLDVKKGEAHGVSAVDYVIAKNTYQSLGDTVISKKNAFIVQLVNRGFNYEKSVYLLEAIGGYELKDSDIAFLKNRLKARK